MQNSQAEFITLTKNFINNKRAAFYDKLALKTYERNDFHPPPAHKTDLSFCKTG